MRGGTLDVRFWVWLSLAFTARGDSDGEAEAQYPMSSFPDQGSYPGSSSIPGMQSQQSAGTYGMMGQQSSGSLMMGQQSSAPMMMGQQSPGPMMMGQQPMMPGYPGPSQPQSSTGQCGMMDQCCGLAQEGCCLGGQQCYTYYENVCDNPVAARCQMRGREFCDEAVMPDCRVVRTKGQIQVEQEECIPFPKQECFTYTRTVCDKQPETVMKEITWTNQKLDKVSSENKTKCQNLNRCNYTTVNETLSESVPVRNCSEIKTTENVCRRIPVTRTKVVEQVVQMLQYVPECQVINEPVCSNAPCQINGCADGGSVCSSSDVNQQTVCPQPVVGLQPRGQQSACQQVQTPVCYGQLGSCSAEMGQQCCSNMPRQVCRQVPRRVPVRRNVTVPEVEWDTQCNDVEKVIPNCEVTYKLENRTISRQVCNDIVVEECYNYTVPSYEVTNEEKTEEHPFVVSSCNLRNITDRYCHTFPKANIRCNNKRSVPRQYILNKVVCDRRRPVKFCRIIPESECGEVPNQQCRVVPKQICQPACNESPMCNKCDSFRNQNGFSSCSTGTCPNYYPGDTFIGINPGAGGQGFNPGYVGGGYAQGGQGYNPGLNVGGGGYNPGGSLGGSGYNPGGSLSSQLYNPGGSLGGQGFNPGYGYGDSYTSGGEGFNPGNLVEVGDGAEEGDVEWDNPGSEWFNPGTQGGQSQGGQGYNPGDSWGSGFNPGGTPERRPGESLFVKEEEKVAVRS